MKCTQVGETRDAIAHKTWTKENPHNLENHYTPPEQSHQEIDPKISTLVAERRGKFN